jgi:UDP-N-acetylmuramate--alanine ligase
MPEAILAAVQPGDVVLTMGAGSIGTVPARLVGARHASPGIDG